MTKQKVYLSVIIPAYNEAKRIGNTLLDIDKYLSEQDYSYEILVVLDGSTDNTPHTVENYKKLVKNLEVIGYKKNQGKGVAVRKGMLYASGEWRLFTDADNATSIDHLDKMWPMVQEGYEVIISSRDSKDVAGARQEISQSFVKRWMGNLANVSIQIIGVWGIWDTQNGFKMLSAKAAQDIFSLTKINRWGFDIELLALAKKLGYKIGIIPALWRNDPMSQVTLLGYLYTFVELLKIRWNLIRNVYDIDKETKK